MSKIIFYLSLITTISYSQNFWIKTPFQSGTQESSVYSILALSNETALAGTFAFGLFKSTNSGNTWDRLIQENLWVKKLVKDNSNKLYAIFVGGSIESGVYKSTNDRNEWTKVFTPPHDGMSTLHIDINNNLYLGFLFYSGEGGIYKSINGGMNWHKIFNLPQNIYTITKTPSGRLIAGSYGKVFFSDDEGLQWNEYSFNLNFQISEITMDNFGDVYLATEGYGVYKSTNNGVTWSSVRGAGPEYSCIYIDNNNHIYLGTRGYWIYRSTDKGINWSLINSGMGQDNFVLSIGGFRGGYIFAGMDYAGIYRSANVVNVESIKDNYEVNFKLEQNFPNPFNPSTVISYSIKESSFVSISIFNAIGEKMETLINEFTKPGTYRIEWNAKECPSSVYFCKMSSGEFSETKKIIFLR